MALGSIPLAPPTPASLSQPSTGRGSLCSSDTSLLGTLGHTPESSPGGHFRWGRGHTCTHTHTHTHTLTHTTHSVAKLLLDHGWTYVYTRYMYYRALLTCELYSLLPPPLPSPPLPTPPAHGHREHISDDICLVLSAVCRDESQHSTGATQTALYLARQGADQSEPLAASHDFPR